MKKIIYTLLIVTFFTSCTKDEDVIDGAAVSFYPASIVNAVEEDGVTYIIELETSQNISGTGTVEIEVSNANYLLTNPPLAGRTITLEITDGNSAQIEVEALDDVLPIDYKAVFRIVGVSGEISDIGRNEFTFFVKDDDTAEILSQDFEDGFGDWTIFNGDGGNTWELTSFNDNQNALTSGFNSPDIGAEDNWLISPEIDFDAQTSEKLSFLSKTRFNEEGNKLEVSILSNYTSGDPADANQTILSPVLDPHTGGGFGNFTESGELDISGVTGLGRVAFRFKAVNDSDASGWEVDDVKITAFDPEGSGNGGSGGGGSGGGGGTGGGGSTIAIPFTDDFESCVTVGDFEVPSNWIEENVPGSKTDRGWGCRAFGRDGTSGPRASAFGGEEGTDNAWLITDGAVDLTSVSSATLVVWVEERFSGPGTLSLKWSSDYSGSGNPEDATWTEVSDFAGQLPTTAEVFTEITSDLSAAAGSQVYIAFQYNGGTSASSIAYTIDDLSITGN